MLQEQRGDFVVIDRFNHCSPPYRRTEGMRHAVGRENSRPSFILSLFSLVSPVSLFSPAPTPITT
jgi:hypothetical protein